MAFGLPMYQKRRPMRPLRDLSHVTVAQVEDAATRHAPQCIGAKCGVCKALAGLLIGRDERRIAC